MALLIKALPPLPLVKNASTPMCSLKQLGSGLICVFKPGFKVACVFMCKESVFKGDLCVLKQSVFNPIRTSHPGGVFTSDVTTLVMLTWLIS